MRQAAYTSPQAAALNAGSLLQQAWRISHRSPLSDYNYLPLTSGFEASLPLIIAT